MNAAIGSININLQGLFGSPTTTAVGRGADNDGDNDSSGSGSVRRGQGGGQLLNAVAQTLSQLGLGKVGQIAVTAPSAAQSASGNNNLDSAPSNVDQALHTFMHSLFQALNQNGGAAQAANASSTEGDRDHDGDRARASGPAGATGYANLVSKLQSFVQNLANGGNAASSATSDLNTAFQSLQQALGGNTATASGSGTGAQVNLQTFLQSLLQNLQSTGGGNTANTVGNLVNTSA